MCGPLLRPSSRNAILSSSMALGVAALVAMAEISRKVRSANRLASVRLFKHPEIIDDNPYVRQCATGTYDSGKMTIDAHIDTIL